MDDKTRNFVRRALLVALGIMLGINIYLLNSVRTVGNQLPMPFEYGLATVQSDSMAPTLSKGDLLVVKQADSYAVGDVVVYQSSGGLVVHRIVIMNEDSVTTKGDANNSPDVPFSYGNIKGVVLVSIPLVGYAIDFLKTPVGIVLILVCAIGLVEMSRRRKKREIDLDSETQKNVMRREIESLKEQMENKR